MNRRLFCHDPLQTPFAREQRQCLKKTTRKKRRKTKKKMRRRTRRRSKKKGKKKRKKKKRKQGTNLRLRGHILELSEKLVRIFQQNGIDFLINWCQFSDILV
jgi:hypothetical protein